MISVRLLRMGSIRSHGGGKGFLRRLSSCNVNEKALLENCAKELQRMGKSMSSQGDLATQITAHLSPSARKEIISARKLVTPPSTEVPEPSRRDLYLVAMTTSIPFVGFGIMDNAILIVAGEAIDESLGVVLGISTMCAAALGNIVSDVCGVMLGTVIEDFCSKLGLPTADLTTAQRALRKVRFAGQLGTAAGLIVGCVIGMFPLLFIDTHRTQELKMEFVVDGVFHEIVSEARNVVGADSTCLFIVVEDRHGSETHFSPAPVDPTAQEGTQHLCGNYVAGTFMRQGGIRWMPIKEGNSIISRVALSGEPIIVRDVQHTTDFAGNTFYPNKSLATTMVCVPVFNSQDKVVGVLQAINKKDGSFDEKDINILANLAEEVGASLGKVNSRENKLRRADSILIERDDNR